MRDKEKKGDGVVSVPSSKDLICSRNDGRGWRCKALKFQDKRYCERHHLLSIRSQKRVQLRKDMGVGKKRKRNTGKWGYSDSSEEDEDDDEDDQEDVLMEKNRNQNKKMKRLSEVKKCDEYTISELVSTLRTAFRSKDFEEVEKVLKMREEKMIMEKDEAEKNAVQFKKLLEVSGASCALLSNELHEKKKITTADGKLEKLEFKMFDIENELLKYKKLSEKFKERVICLEEEQKNVCEREKRLNERVKELNQINSDERGKLIKLKTENIELQSAKRRAENELELWMARIKDLDTQALLESHVSQMGYVQPICPSTQDPYAEEGKKTDSKPFDYGLASACLSVVKVKEEALECDGRFYASANPETVCFFSAKGYGVAKDAESGVQYGGNDRVQTVLSSSKLGIMDSDSKKGTSPDESLSKKVLQRTCLRETEVNSAFTSPCFSNTKIKEDDLNRNEIVYDFTNILAKNSGVASQPRSNGQELLDTKMEARPKEKFAEKILQNTCLNLSEAFPALNSPCFSNMEPKEDALNLNGKVYNSANILAKTSGVASHPSSNGQKLLDIEMDARPKEHNVFQPLQRACLKQSEAIPAYNSPHFSHMEIKEGLNCSGNIYASENMDSTCHPLAGKSRVAHLPDSSEDHCCVTPNVSTRGEHVKEFLTPSCRRLISPQQTDDQRNRAKQILPNNFEISGTSWKKSGSSTAKKHNEKVTQYSESGCIAESFSRVVRNQNDGPSKEASSMEPETALDGISKFLCALRKAKNKT